MKRSAAAIAALALVLAACSSEPSAGPAASPPPASPSVTIKMFAFDPQDLAVKAGQSVTWTNQDEILHTVTAGTPDQPEPQTYDGQLDDVGSSFSFTFDEPGRYAYFCTRHATAMTGTVVVG